MPGTSGRYNSRLIIKEPGACITQSVSEHNFITFSDARGGWPGGPEWARKGLKLFSHRNIIITRVDESRPHALD